MQYFETHVGIVLKTDAIAATNRASKQGPAHSSRALVEIKIKWSQMTSMGITVMSSKNRICPVRIGWKSSQYCTFMVVSTSAKQEPRKYTNGVRDFNNLASFQRKTAFFEFDAVEPSLPRNVRTNQRKALNLTQAVKHGTNVECHPHVVFEKNPSAVHAPFTRKFGPAFGKAPLSA